MPRYGDISLTDSGTGNYQSSETNELKNTQEAEKVLKKAKILRKSRRKEIEEEHQRRRQVLKRKIDKHFETRRINVDKAQNDVWEKLIALDKRRQVIEGLIIDSTKRFEHATRSLTSQLLAQLDNSIQRHMAINFENS